VPVFPTPVGMNRDNAPDVRFRGRVPHARGDEPLIVWIVLPALACSPRPWG